MIFPDDMGLIRKPGAADSRQVTLLMDEPASDAEIFLCGEGDEWSIKEGLFPLSRPDWFFNVDFYDLLGIFR